MQQCQLKIEETTNRQKKEEGWREKAASRVKAATRSDTRRAPLHERANSRGLDALLAPNTEEDEAAQKKKNKKKRRTSRASIW